MKQEPKFKNFIDIELSRLISMGKNPSYLVLNHDFYALLESELIKEGVVIYTSPFTPFRYKGLQVLLCESNNKYDFAY